MNNKFQPMVNSKSKLLFILPICSLLIMITKPNFILRWNTLITGMVIYLMLLLPLAYLIPQYIKSEKLRKNVKLVLILLSSTFFITGGILGVMLFDDKKDSQLDNGITVEAIVIDRSSTSSRKGEGFNITVEYLTQDHGKLQKTFLVNEIEYHRSKIGNKIKVVYSDKDNQIAEPIFTE